MIYNPKRCDFKACLPCFWCNFPLFPFLLFRFLFPIFQKFITKGYVSQRLAGERVAQVATLKEYAKPAVHWSWGNRQKLGRKAFSQKLSKRIIDSNISRQTYELTKKLVGLA